MVIGQLHDLGKAKDTFQQRLRGGPKVEHAADGARAAIKGYEHKPELAGLALIMAYCIAGHHSGLPNGVDLQSRLKKESLADSIFQEAELPHSLGVPFLFSTGFSISFLIRMLFSCLVDADFLDTEKFMEPEIADLRVEQNSLSPMKKLLDIHLQEKICSIPDSNIKTQRINVLTQCRKAALEPPGLFSLTAPTGGGKTLSSLAFALDHANKHNKRRVIYVIPYTSIIEQNAKVFRDILGNAAVLEHHSNFDPKKEDDDGCGKDKIRLATENWNAPIIVTTNVQFFESLFANRSSKCRKLHNIANSIVILDEAQMLPTPLLQPCLAALTELSKHYGVSTVLCSATQPALQQSPWMENGLQGVREIIDDPASLYEALRRVKVETLGITEDIELTNRLASHEQGLVIVNTRAHASKLYQQLLGKPGLFHLSARMCPAHRTIKLNQIREALDNNNPCLVISTQLIEAGVDIDFPVVYRALTGLDSIAQAAGRCNREGGREFGKVFVFEPVGEKLRGDRQRRASGGRTALKKFTDPLDLQAIHKYFQFLYEASELDEKQIVDDLSKGLHQVQFKFRDAAEKFRMIDTQMQDLIVPFDSQAEKLINKLRFTDSPSSLLRPLQAYTVQLHPAEIKALLAAKVVELFHERFYVLLNNSLYEEELGVSNNDPTFMTAESCFV